MTFLNVNKMFLATTMKCGAADSLPKAWRFDRRRIDTWCYEDVFLFFYS